MKYRFLLVLGLLVLLLLPACAGTAGVDQDTPVPPTPTTVATAATQVATAAPTVTIEQPPVLAELYEPLPQALCQELQAAAAEALGVEVSRTDSAPFLDPVAGEAGQGCRLTVSGTGENFTDPQTVVSALENSVGLGWTPQAAYQADGPTGQAVGLVRDMALMLIQAGWTPAEGVECPADQPISACDLTPAQRIYAIQVDAAMYKADFSLDGHWEDAATGFSLDLYQEWKNIWGQHMVVAQGGNKIDALEASISGSLQGKVATVQFQSSFASETGTAQLTYVDTRTMIWKIIDPPEGEYYLPAEATLVRE